jgi:hypothetical protein
LGIFCDVMVSRSFADFMAATSGVSKMLIGIGECMNTFGLLIAASPHAACR